jgi:multiphosphoryl transfer protein
VEEQRIDGLAASPGVALAAAWQPRRASGADLASLTADDDTVRDAFATVADDLGALADSMRRKGLREEAAILAAESAIARDEELVGAVLSYMSQGLTAGAAIHSAGEDFAAMLEALESAYLRERAADIRQVVRRALDSLAGGRDSAPPPKPFILLDSDVGPVDLLEVASHGLAGAVSFRGGVNAHAAIVARSLGIPLLIGVDTAQLPIDDGAIVLLDADQATLVVAPSPASCADANQRINDALARREHYALERDLPMQTADGRKVTLLCNAASATEVRIGLDAGASGVGLLRTELPFLHAAAWPGESAHREVLTPIFEHLDDVPVTVRLMDFSNDKLPPFLTDGLEGLEALLANPEALHAQLTAVVDVGRRAQTRVMLPMVRHASEVSAVRVQLRAIAQKVGAAPLLGIMVELPEAVAAATELAQVADFFSLGTNDLTAAVLKLSRTDQGARPALAAHPAVLKHIVATCRAAADTGISLSVCGDAGGDPLVLPLLLGAGVRTFSVSPARVDEVRYRIRRIDASEWAGRLHDVLELGDVESVWKYVEAASSR